MPINKDFLDELERRGAYDDMLKSAMLTMKWIRERSGRLDEPQFKTMLESSIDDWMRSYTRRGHARNST